MTDDQHITYRVDAPSKSAIPRTRYPLDERLKITGVTGTGGSRPRLEG